MTTSKSIRQKIATLPQTEPFTPTLFVGLGSRAAIDQTLMRLTKEGVIERVGRGVYVRPKLTRFGFNALPSPEQVAQAVAESEGAKIEIQGAEAARRFGFSTQMPLQSIFLTTGSSRHVTVGKHQVRLKHVAPRKLALAGTPAGQAMSALWYLGKKEVNGATFAKLAQQLPPNEFRTLSAHKSSMPTWMASALTRYENRSHA